MPSYLLLEPSTLVDTTQSRQDSAPVLHAKRRRHAQGMLFSLLTHVRTAQHLSVRSMSSRWLSASRRSSSTPPSRPSSVSALEHPRISCTSRKSGGTCYIMTSETLYPFFDGRPLDRPRYSRHLLC